jgi:hypothetical protein
MKEARPGGQAKRSKGALVEGETCNSVELSAEVSGAAKACSRSSEIVAHDALKSVLTIPRSAQWPRQIVLK